MPRPAPPGSGHRAGPLRLATRGSPLALWQAHRVAGLLAAVPGAPPCEPLVVRTTGDLLSGVPVAQLGGQGAFVKEVQGAVLDGRADLAVHSAKDLPSLTPSGLVLACVPERADPRDVMVGGRLDDLRTGATVATGSARRRAQLAWLRPDLTFCDLRGNMATRLEVATRVGAGVLALAALERLGLSDQVAEVLDPGSMLPQVGQGALAVECRADDHELLELLGRIDDARARAEVTAERAFLAELGGGCTLPVGALAVRRGRTGGADGHLPSHGVGWHGRDHLHGHDPHGRDPHGIEMDGLVASRDGRVLLRRRATGDDPEELGRRLAGDLLDRCGGRWLEDWADRAPALEGP